VLQPPVGFDGALVVERLQVTRFVQRHFEHGGGSLVDAGAGTVHQFAELQQAAAGGAAHTQRFGTVDHLGQRSAASRCRIVQLGNGAVADAASGQVHNPLERHLVGRVHGCSQVGQRVLDLAPVVEAGAADDLVRHVVGDELFLDHARLGVGSVEDRSVRPVDPAVAVQAAQLRADVVRLVFLIGAAVADRLGTAGLIGPEVLRRPSEVVADHRVGGVEDRLTGPVVLVEHVGRGMVERGAELQDVGDVGPPERVDRLVGVADHEDVLGGPAQQPDQAHLCQIRVLVLIDQDVLEALPVVLGHLVVSAEQFHAQHQQIVEVHGTGAPQPLLVLGIDASHFTVERPAAVGRLGPLRSLRRRGELVLQR